MPPKLSARARVFSTGQGRKTNTTDAHSIALVGTRMADPRPVMADERPQVLRLLLDRRRALGEEHTRKVSQLHALLLELIPGGADQRWSEEGPLRSPSQEAARHRATRDAVGKTRRPTDGRAYYDRKKVAGKSSIEAMRCLKSRLSDTVYRTMIGDLVEHAATGAGRAPGQRL